MPGTARTAAPGLPTERGGRPLVWVCIVVAVLLALGGVAAVLARFDERHGSEFLSGVTVNGIAIGGMDFDAAYRLLAVSIEDPLDRPVTVSAGGQTFSVTPRQLGATTDLERRLREATALHRTMPVSKRVWHRLTGSPVHARFQVSPSVDETPVGVFVNQVAAAVDAPAKNSAPALAAGDTLQFSPAVPGRALDRVGAGRQIVAAMRKGETSADLTVTPVAPATTPESFSDVLVIKIGDNKLLHFHRSQLVKTYEVAAGSRRYPTPKGGFKIVSKRFRPTWVNPAKYSGGWGAGLPARIGPGPGNPLGTRALDLNVGGIRIHGTSNHASIGYNVSHGCIRMRMPEVEELFDLVGVGTPVLILQTADLRSQPVPAAPTLEDLAEADGTQIPGVPAAPAPAPPPVPVPTVPTVPTLPAPPGAPGAVTPATPESPDPNAPGQAPTQAPTPAPTPGATPQAPFQVPVSNGPHAALPARAG